MEWKLEMLIDGGGQQESGQGLNFILSRTCDILQWHVIHFTQDFLIFNEVDKGKNCDNQQEGIQ